MEVIHVFESCKFGNIEQDSGTFLGHDSVQLGYFLLQFLGLDSVQFLIYVCECNMETVRGMRCILQTGCFRNLLSQVSDIRILSCIRGHHDYVYRSRFLECTNILNDLHLKGGLELKFVRTKNLAQVFRAPFNGGTGRHGSWPMPPGVIMFMRAIHQCNMVTGRWEERDLVVKRQTSSISVKVQQSIKEFGILRNWKNYGVTAERFDNSVIIKFEAHLNSTFSFLL